MDHPLQAPHLAYLKIRPRGGGVVPLTGAEGKVGAIVPAEMIKGVTGQDHLNPGTRDDIGVSMASADIEGGC